MFSCGRVWDEGKNLLFFLSRPQHLNIPIKIAGAFNDKTIQENKDVHYIGNISPHSMREFLQQAIIFVSPSLYEPFGLSVLEAAFSGCALLLSEIDSFKEIWEDHALYFNPRNYDDFLKKAKMLTDDKKFREELSAKATQRAYRFTADQMAFNYMKTYTHLVNL